MSYPVIAWMNWLTADPAPAVTHPADDSGYPFANASDWRDYTAWRTSAAGPLAVTLDAAALPGGKITVDAFGLAGHNLASAGCEGLCLYAGDDEDHYEACFPAFTPAGDVPLLKHFAAVEKRFFKFIIPAGFTGPLEIGELFIGRSLEIPAFPDTGFDPDGIEEEPAAETSRAGRLLGLTPRCRRRTVTARFSRLPAAFIADEWRPFFAAHGWKPFFFGWDLGGHPDEALLARLSAPKLSAPYEGPWRSLALELVGPAD